MNGHIIYRLYPSFGECSGVLLDDGTSDRLLGRLKGEAETLDVARVEWLCDPSGPRGDYPCGSKSAPIFSKRVCDHFREALNRSGQLIPIIDKYLQKDEYWLYVVDATVDCLDAKRSSPPAKYTREMSRPVFLGEKLDLSLPAFRIPQNPFFVFWNRPFVDALRDFGATALWTRIVWAEDPTIEIAERPML